MINAEGLSPAGLERAIAEARTMEAVSLLAPLLLKDEDYVILAVQGRDEHLEIRLRCLSKKFVVHLYNKGNDSYCYGDYCQRDLAAALDAFAQKCKRWAA